MNSVYAVEQGICYEGSRLVALFDNKEAAELMALHVMSDYTGEWIWNTVDDCWWNDNVFWVHIRLHPVLSALPEDL